jgi:hypothetical protein
MVAEPKNGRHQIIVVNDTLSDVVIDLEVRSIEQSAELLRHALTVPANGRAEVGDVPVSSSADLYQLTWRDADSVGRNHYLAGPRPFDLEQYPRWVAQLALEMEIPAFASD